MNRLNSHTRFRLIVSALILFPFLAYFLAIGDTVALIQESAGLSQQQADIGGIDERIDRAEVQLTKVTNRLGMLEENSRSFQQALLGEVSSYSEGEGLSVVDFPAPITRVEDDLQFETMAFTVQGDYAAMVRLINQLENKAMVGKLISADFQRVRLRTSRKEVLQLTLYVQNISRTT